MPDLACIVHAIVLMAVRFELRIWWEYVDSKANPADGGSRASSAVTDQLGIQLVHKKLPPWPDRTTQASAEQWLSWLGEWFPLVSN